METYFDRYETELPLSPISTQTIYFVTRYDLEAKCFNYQCGTEGEWEGPYGKCWFTYDVGDRKLLYCVNGIMNGKTLIMREIFFR